MSTPNTTVEPPDSVESTIEPRRIAELANGFRGAKTLLSAVELGLFTKLAGASRDAGTLSQEVGIAARGARDFLDTLVALGLLDRDGAGRYRNTPETEQYLDANKPAYMGAELAHLNVRMYPHWQHLTKALRSGEPQSDAGTEGYFNTLYSDEARRELFVKGMTAGARRSALAIARRFPWREFATVMDVGTAEGGLPVEIATVHPHITGGGFDLPAVAPQFDRHVRAHNLSERLRFYPGDFHCDPLPRMDVMVFGRVLHNWDLATKKMLLKKAHDALPTGGAVIIYERLIDDDRRVNAQALLGSLNMLLMTSGGFDFTGADCVGWMEETGFREICVGALTSDMSMVTGLK